MNSCHINILLTWNAVFIDLAALSACFQGLHAVKLCSVLVTELAPSCNTCKTILTYLSNLEKKCIYKYNICFVFLNLTVKPHEMSFSSEGLC